MKNIFAKFIDKLIGDSRLWSLEHRLFNSFALLNGVSNTLGSLNPSSNYSWLFGLNLGTGILFLAFYALSRFRSFYRSLYWPFVFTMQIFLFFNIIGNAGSQGGAHYYYIPMVLISTILSRSTLTTVIAAGLGVIFTCGVFAIEMYKPEWIMQFSRPEDRLNDVVGQFLFVQALCGGTVIILKNHFNEERNKSEKLLRNILPVHVADELKRYNRVTPMHFDSASVLFTDMVGFTKIAERLSPDELIRELDGCFAAFDEIIRKFDMEKIKTIGDAYMAAGGLPDINQSHPLDAVLVALQMQHFMLHMKKEKEAKGQPFWQIRLGIHTGPLVAGVIGTEKFSYDVWGDTVNTASRMESSGAPEMINISRNTYDLVQDFFICEYRGKLVAKNKGEVDMYFVKRLKPDYSEDVAGIIPNQKLLLARGQLNGLQVRAA
jgi:adenylate cyclase